MRYLKKVSVTSNNTSGKIIDSFNSGDNHQVNAPSINAVEQRIQGCDNNLLFNSDFVCNKNEAGAPTGWTLGGGVWYAPSSGLRIISNNSPEIMSPLIFPVWFAANDGAFTFPITVSFEIDNALNEGEIKTYSTTFNTFIEALSGKTVTELYGGVSLACKAVALNNLGYALSITSETIPSGLSSPIYIRRIKAELGASATPIIKSMRDYSLINAIQGLFATTVAGLKVFEFDGTLPTTTSSYEALNADTGYNLNILAAYAYNRADSKYYEMAKPEVVGATYYRPSIYCYGNQARIQLDSQSVTNYAGQAYKVFALGWKES